MPWWGWVIVFCSILFSVTVIICSVVWSRAISNFEDRVLSDPLSSPISKPSRPFRGF